MQKDILTSDHSAPRPSIDSLALALVGIIVFSAAWSIAEAEWMPRLDLLGLTVVVGLFTGAVVATRRWRARIAHIIMFLYGIVWVSFVALYYLPDKVYGWTWLDTLRHMIVRLGEHFYVWLQAATTGGVGKDNTIFLISLASIFWLITYLAVWNTIRRQHMWLAVAPAGVALLINMYYYGGPHSLFLLLVVYLFGVLLYAARMYTLKQEQRWHFSRVRFNPEIKRDFLQIGAGIALAAVMFGAVAPTLAGAPQLSTMWHEISRPVRSVEDTFSRLFSDLQPHGLPFANPFGRTLALLGQRNLGNELVMEVRAPEGHYWQAVAYDQYTGSAFQSSETVQTAVDQDARPITANFEQRSLVTQTVSVYFPNNTLVFAAPQPIAVNQAAWIDAHSGSDVTMWTTLSPLSAGDSYRVVSAVSQATVDQLRAAGTNYPADIRTRYLQLPSSLPDRVRQLARRIVTDAKATNSYDQASALELWLRTNIKYNDQIQAPAPGQDGVDYVLFEAKQGYCDYYASAMAVMARTMGIPARIVTGYSQGTFDSQRNAYEVYQFNAHTWVEVYFPKYGWIQFEPTASQPSIERPQPAAGPDANLADNGPNGLARGREARDLPFDPLTGPASPVNPTAPPQISMLPTTLLFVLSGVGLLLLVAAGVFAGMWLYENRGTSNQMGGGTWAFARLMRMSNWLRVRHPPSHTPYEQAQAITTVLPHSEAAIDQLTGMYVRERYGRSPIELNEAKVTWRNIHWSLWWAGFKQRIPRSLPSPRRILRRRK